MKKIIRIIITIAILLGLCFIINKLINLGPNIKKIEVEKVINNTANENTSTAYNLFGSNMIMINTDEIKLTNLNINKTLWAEKISIPDRIYKIEKDYILLAQRFGYQVFTFNQKGKVTSFNTQYQIMDAGVNNNGYIWIIQDDGDKNVITIYDESGKRIIERVVYVDKSGRPMSCDIATDNRHAAISYIRVDGLIVKSDIEFFDIKSDELKDNIYAKKTYEMQYLYKVKYNKSGDLVALSDKKIMLINIEKDYSKEIELKNKVDKIYFDINENKIIALLGETLDKSETSNKKLLSIFDGNSLSERKVELKDDVSYFKYEGKRVLIGQKNYMLCYGLGAEQIWKVSMSVGFNDVVLENSSKILVVGGSNKTIYKIK